MREAIKRHGGKSYLAKRIVELMPPRAKNPNAPTPDDPGWLHYAEPYFGGGAVLFANDPEGISEVVNDIDWSLTNFWNVIRDPEHFEHFRKGVESMPVCSSEFEKAQERLEIEGYGCFILAAVDFFVVNRQSRQALGKDFATLSRNRTRRGMNEQASAWLSAIKGLPEVHARLRRVVILNEEAVKVIRQQDGPRTLFYLDPPYLHETRTVTDAYEHEMSSRHHAILLAALAGEDRVIYDREMFEGLGGDETYEEFLDAMEKPLVGRFILSGYRSKLYDDFADTFGWNRVDIEIDNKAGSGKTKQRRIESLWRNYA